MESMEDRKIILMEDTILRWKRSSDTARAGLVGAVIVCGILMLLLSTKKERLIISIICLLACALITVCDIMLQRYIAEGEREWFSASHDLIDVKEKLASIGAMDFDAAASRRLLNMNMPDRKVKIPLALYIITDGIAIAAFIVALVKYF